MRCAQLEEMRWERDQLLGRLIERDFRHEVQMSRMQKQMFMVSCLFSLPLPLSLSLSLSLCLSRFYIQYTTLFAALCLSLLPLVWLYCGRVGSVCAFLPRGYSVVDVWGRCVRSFAAAERS